MGTQAPFRAGEVSLGGAGGPQMGCPRSALGIAKSENVTELPKIWWGAHVRRALTRRLDWAGLALTVWRSQTDPPVQGPRTTQGRGEIQHFLQAFTETVGVVGHQQGWRCCRMVTREIGTSRCPNPPYEAR